MIQWLLLRSISHSPFLFGWLKVIHVLCRAAWKTNRKEPKRTTGHPCFHNYIFLIFGFRHFPARVRHWNIFNIDIASLLDFFNFLRCRLPNINFTSLILVFDPPHKFELRIDVVFQSEFCVYSRKRPSVLPRVFAVRCFWDNCFDFFNLIIVEFDCNIMSITISSTDL